MSKVTVLVAAYNAEQYIARCLDSLRAQSHRDWQAVCVDDASSDGTLAILKDYAATDSRIEVVSMNKNGGQAKARNLALERAQG